MVYAGSRAGFHSKVRHLVSTQLLSVRLNCFSPLSVYMQFIDTYLNALWRQFGSMPHCIIGQNYQLKMSSEGILKSWKLQPDVSPERQTKHLGNTIRRGEVHYHGNFCLFFGNVSPWWWPNTIITCSCLSEHSTVTNTVCSWFVVSTIFSAAGASLQPGGADN